MKGAACSSSYNSATAADEGPHTVRYIVNKIKIAVLIQGNATPPPKKKKTARADRLHYFFESQQYIFTVCKGLDKKAC